MVGKSPTIHTQTPTAHRQQLIQLYRRPKFGHVTGLHRMQRWISRLHDHFPDPWPPVVSVVGSNGKGSTTAMIHNILSQIDPNVGRYTSPHLVDFRERIRCGKNDVDDFALGLALDWFNGHLNDDQARESIDPTTAFESFTTLALFVFLRAKVSLIVAEAGMGGKLDPTSCLEPTLVAFPSIDLEHTEILGTTLEQIALEKAGIASPGATLWLGPLPTVIKQVIQTYCASNTVDLHTTPPPLTITPTALGQTLDLQVQNDRITGIPLPLFGRFQAENAALAANVAAVVMQRFWQVDNPTRILAICRGLSTIEWSGRMQLVSQFPKILADVGHSPDAIACAAEGVLQLAAGNPIHVVVGVSYNKPITAIVAAAAQVAHVFYCTTAQHRGAPANVILQAAQQVAPSVSAQSFPDVAAALDAAMVAARSDNGLVWVAGGFFLAAEAIAILQGHPLDTDLLY